MKTAVVILNYNGRGFLEQFLGGVVRFSADASVIVADNASTDDSVPFLQANYPEVGLIRLAENYGFAGGYNHALKEIDAEYLVLLNSDVEVTEAWLKPLVGYMDAHPEVAACQPKIRAFADKSRFEYAGAAGGYLDKYGYPFCRGRIFGTTETDEGQYDSIATVFWATGACLVVRSKDFWAAGALDERFFAHMEEIDLCWRLQGQGRGIACVPQSTVYHVGGGTLTVESPRKTYLNFRNNLLMLYKNLPDERLRRTLFIRKILDGVAAAEFFLTGKPTNALSVWKAHRSFARMKTDYLREHTMPLSALQGFYNKSILFDYYLRGKKNFRLLS